MCLSQQARFDSAGRAHCVPLALRPLGTGGQAAIDAAEASACAASGGPLYRALPARAPPQWPKHWQTPLAEAYRLNSVCSSSVSCLG